MYDILVIDPPWPVKKSGKRKARPNPNNTGSLVYKTMSLTECLDLSSELCSEGNENHSVFMWTTDKYVSEVDLYMKSLGYKKHVTFIWDKLCGLAPAFSVRFCHEYCIWYYKGKFPGVAKDVRGKYSTVLSGGKREHSRKPEIFYTMLEELFPTKTKKDYFSREPREGWSQFGDQCNHFKGDHDV